MSIIVCLHDLSMLYVDTRTSFDHALSHKSMVHGSIVYVPLAKFGALEKKTGLQDVKVWNYSTWEESLWKETSKRDLR